MFERILLGVCLALWCGSWPAAAATNKTVMVDANRMTVYPATGSDLVLTNIVVKVAAATNGASPVTLAQLQGTTNDLPAHIAVNATQEWSHVQYPGALLTNGVRKMGAGLGMGGFDVTNAGHMVVGTNTWTTNPDGSTSQVYVVETDGDQTGRLTIAGKSESHLIWWNPSNGTNLMYVLVHGSSSLTLYRWTPSGGFEAIWDATAAGMDFQGLNVTNASYFGNAGGLTNLPSAEITAIGDAAYVPLDGSEPMTGNLIISNGAARVSSGTEAQALTLQSGGGAGAQVVIAGTGAAPSNSVSIGCLDFWLGEISGVNAYLSHIAGEVWVWDGETHTNMGSMYFGDTGARILNATSNMTVMPGTGGRVYVYELHVNSSVGNSTVINTDVDLYGHMTLQDSVYRSIYIPAAEMTEVDSACLLLSSITGSVVNVDTGLFAYDIGFPATVPSGLVWHWMLPSDYKANGNVYIWKHWRPSDTSAGDAVWWHLLGVANVGGIITTTATTITNTVGGVAYVHARDEVQSITSSVYTDTATISGVITRLGNETGDTYPATAIFDGIEIVYQVDEIGDDTAN